MGSPTVFGTARFGVVDDSSETGLHVASLTYTYSSETAQGRDSTGFTVAMSVFEDKTDVTADGVVKTSGTGIIPAIGAVIALANESDGGQGLNDDNLMSTAVATAGTVVTGGSMTRTNTDFETGSLTLVFYPLVATS